MNGACGVHGQTGPLVLSRAVVDKSGGPVAATTRHRRTEAPIVAEITRNHEFITVLYVQVRIFQSHNLYQSSFYHNYKYVAHKTKRKKQKMAVVATTYTNLFISSKPVTYLTNLNLLTYSIHTISPTNPPN